MNITKWINLKLTKHKRKKITHSKIIGKRLPWISFKDWLIFVKPWAILISIIAIVLSVASAYWTSTVSSLNSQLSQQRDENSKLSQEIALLMSESQQKLKPNNFEPINPVTTDVDSAKAGIIKTKIELGNLNQGESKIFFDGDVIISIVAIDFKVDPVRYTVDLKIGSYGKQTSSYSNKDTGFTIDFSGQRKYQIRILSISSSYTTIQAISM